MPKSNATPYTRYDIGVTSLILNKLSIVKNMVIKNKIIKNKLKNN